MFSKYRFKAYHELCKELADCAAIVQSEKLSVALHESIQAIQKLVVLCQEKEEHIQRRARQQYATLRHFALYSLGRQPLSHTHDDCRDDQPRHWANDCPRCLAVALALADERPLPGFACPDNLKKKARSPKMAQIGI
ncbi:MAG: hypothetical protein JNM56_04535 [Planctomycetia bacterium]|nr:hypothetical protein [Planctomycetia bacterium]